jgi:type IV pilus assembly protein PilO
MANLRHARRRIYIILGVLLAVDIAAAAVLLTPVASGSAQRQQEFDAVRRQVQHKLQVVIPPDQAQARVNQARTQIDGFFKERLAPSASALTTEVGKLAASSGVRLGSAKYAEPESERSDLPDLPGLAHVRIEASITGDYLSIVKFINAVERDKMFFIIDNVALTEQQGGSVGLAVKLETYLKSGAE